MRPFYVYVIRCGDGSFYVGHTDDLERRWAEHREGVDAGCYTFARQPLRLVLVDEQGTREEAIERERQIKGWTRAKKAALIRSDWDSLRRLARGSAGPSTPRGPSARAPLRTNGRG